MTFAASAPPAIEIMYFFFAIIQLKLTKIETADRGH